MKNLIVSSIAAALLLSVTSAMATDCPNFAGTYQLKDDSTIVTLTVTQTKCTSVSFTYAYSDTGQELGKTYPMDNVRRQTYEDSHLIVYETAGLQGDALTNLVEDYEKATATTTTADSTFTIDGSGNLDAKDAYYDSTGKLTQSDDNYFVRVAK